MTIKKQRFLSERSYKPPQALGSFVLRSEVRKDSSTWRPTGKDVDFVFMASLNVRTQWTLAGPTPLFYSQRVKTQRGEVICPKSH